jgi:hypothetical protein
VLDPSFTQLLSGIENQPQNDHSMLQSWSKTPTQNPNLQAAAFPSACYANPFPATAAWAHPTSPEPSSYLLDQDLSNLMDFPKLEPFNGTDPVIGSASNLADHHLGFYNQKSLQDLAGSQSFGSDFNAFESTGTTLDENNTIINLGQFQAGLDDPINLQNGFFPRRPSSSSYVSSAGAMNDPTDTTCFPDGMSYASDFTPQSSLNMSSTPLSPVASPRCSAREMVRAASQTRATPSPRTSLRSNPYPPNAALNKRSSSGSYSSPQARKSSPSAQPAPESYFPPMPMQPQAVSATSHPMVQNALSSSNINPAMQYNPALGAVPRFFHQAQMPPSTFDPSGRIETVPFMMSNGTFRTLQSNASSGGHQHDRSCDHADPPDLFGPLTQEQLVPPLEDMKPDNADLTPHEQDLRFEGDLYTPRFVRGQGNKREGWCGICKPGRWLVLKNSAYWYDKSFTHGISASTGQAFARPLETRRMDSNADAWEGLCGNCGDWIALVSSKKKGTIWFRHAYKVLLTLSYVFLSCLAY